MRAKISFFIAVLALIFLEGCIASLHPLYTAKDLLYDPRLAGTWKAEESGETWKLERLMDHELQDYADPAERKKQEGIKTILGTDQRSYLLTYTEKGEAATFTANLLSLDGHLFMDIFPRSLPVKNSLLEGHYLPVHSYAKVNISAGRVELYFFNAEKIYSLMAQNRIRLKHESFEYYSVITASTAELQQFVKKYADHTDFFEKPLVLKK